MPEVAPRRLIATVVGVLVAGALYLYLVRGPAIFVEMANAISAYCF
jgi:hypothetical protein